jgi:hypothetical protein
MAALKVARKINALKEQLRNAPENSKAAIREKIAAKKAQLSKTT